MSIEIKFFEPFSLQWRINSEFSFYILDERNYVVKLYLITGF